MLATTKVQTSMVCCGAQSQSQGNAGLLLTGVELHDSLRVISVCCVAQGEGGGLVNCAAVVLSTADDSASGNTVSPLHKRQGLGFGVRVHDP